MGVVCMKCSHCGLKDNLIKYSKPKLIQYYMCRDCNTQRHRKYLQTIGGKKTVYKATLKYNKSHPERVRAWSKVSRTLSIQSSKIPCYCGEIKVDGHHPNPIERDKVIWLCRLHHVQRHKNDLL